MRSERYTTTALVIVLLALTALCLALAHNLLSEPLGCEAVLQRFEVCHDILAAPDDGVLRGYRAIGRDAELEGRE